MKFLGRGKRLMINMAHWEIYICMIIGYVLKAKITLY